MRTFELRPDLPELELRLDKKGQRTHFFRVPDRDDWLAYHDALQGSRVTALGLLWTRLILRVEGYGGGEDWKARIPLEHRLYAVTGFTVVVPADVIETPDSCEVELVVAGPYVPLIHVFRRPGATEAASLDRIHAEWVRRREVRKKGPSLRVPLPFESLPLYDELISEVRGYTVNGEIPTREQVVQYMDHWHRLAALQGLLLQYGPTEGK